MLGVLEGISLSIFLRSYLELYATVFYCLPIAYLHMSNFTQQFAPLDACALDEEKMIELYVAIQVYIAIIF